jgi:hypothetical protein
MEYLPLDMVGDNLKKMDLGVERQDKTWYNFTKAKYVYTKDKINKKCVEKEIYYKPYDMTN